VPFMLWTQKTFIHIGYFWKKLDQSNSIRQSWFIKDQLCANKEDLLHVPHCIVSLITFSWNMCYLIRLHVDMLTLLKRLLTKEQMLIKKVRMERCLLYLACKKTTMELFWYYSCYSIPFLLFPNLFFGFIDHALCKL